MFTIKLGLDGCLWAVFENTDEAWDYCEWLLSQQVSLPVGCFGQYENALCLNPEIHDIAQPAPRQSNRSVQMNKLDKAKLEQIRKAMRVAPTLDLMIALWQQGLDLLKAEQERECDKNATRQKCIPAIPK